MTVKFRARFLLWTLSIFLVAASSVALAQASKPITYKGLTDALKIGGLESSEIAQLVNQRGVDFELTSEREAELKSLGATSALLRAVRANYRTAAQEIVTKPIEKPSGGNHSNREVTSVRDLKKIYIEKMPNDLDEYIKAEISRQMPGRLVVVLHRDEAEAVMSGTATNNSGHVRITNMRGSVELWVGEAGDMGIHLKSLHGGPKDVAKKIVSNLKKATE